MFSVQLTKSHGLNNLITHFLSKQPVKDIQWKSLFGDLTCQDQVEIIKNTVDSELVCQFPISLSYQKQFLKALIQYLELEKSVIENSVYEAFGRLVAQPTNSNFCFAFYPLKIREKKLPLIILKENVNIISDGTTGLRTWEASLALAEWVLQNESYVDKKNILELGSGIGLTGLVIAHSTNPAKYVLTDCHPSVLSVLCENANLNTEKQGNSEESKLFDTVVNTCNLQISELSWENTTSKTCEQFGFIDFVFAADVVYDSDLFEPLLKTLITFFKAGTKEAIFACTERNSDTLKTFWKACDSSHLIVEFLKTPEPLHLTWTNSTPIFLTRILPSAE